MISSVNNSSVWTWTKPEDIIRAANAEKSAGVAFNSATGDTVEISDAARALQGESGTARAYDTHYISTSGAMLLELGADGQIYDAVTKQVVKTGSLQSILDNWDEKKDGSCANIELVKDALDFLVPEKKTLKNLINKLGKEAGLSQTDINKMKIEVNSKGEIVVGGLDDKKKLERMEHALNGETGLAARLKNYQNAEMILQRNTNYSRDKFAANTGDAEQYRSLVFQEKGDGSEMWEDDPEIVQYGLDKAMQEAMQSFYADETESADFSYGVKGVANPEGALEHFAEKTKVKLKAALNEYNVENGLSGDDEAKLDGVSFTLDSNGALKIEGNFSNNEMTDGDVRALVQKLIRNEIDGDGEGGQSMFQTALSSLIRGHDQAFGEDAADGKRAVFQFGQGVLNDLYVDAPDRKEELNKEATSMIADFVNDSGAASVAADDFEINQNGRISYKGDLDGKLKTDINDVLGDLRYALDKIKGGEEGMFDEANATYQKAQEMASLIAEFTSYGPGADNSYMVDNKNLAEETFLALDTCSDFMSRYDYKYHATKSGEGKQKATFDNYSYEPFMSKQSKGVFMRDFFKGMNW